ncbi:MAG: reverse transcriptase family protein [candidate division Zixibacteria bacterium]|nr:reverse transcriptase family protein [candidate division Zixibacteria bacterium]
MAKTLKVPVDDLFAWCGRKKRFVTEEERLIGAKYRQLKVPHGEFKELLRKIDQQLKRCPIPNYFYGSRKGVSAIDCALVHLHSPYILKLDLKDFFPSTDYRRVSNSLSQVCDKEAVLKLLTELCTFQHHLPQGFPTSTTIAELTLIPLAQRLFGMCNQYGLQLSIYVDDICISGSPVLLRLEARILRMFQEMHFRLNLKKKELRSKQEGIAVTGVFMQNGFCTTKPKFDEKLLKKIWAYELAQMICDSTLAEDLLGSIRGQLLWTRQLDESKYLCFLSELRQGQMMSGT